MLESGTWGKLASEEVQQCRVRLLITSKPLEHQGYSPATQMPLAALNTPDLPSQCAHWETSTPPLHSTREADLIYQDFQK